MSQFSNSYNVKRNDSTLGTLATGASYSIFAEGDVLLAETVNKSTVYFPGDSITFTLTITNNSGAAIDAVDITDTIDSGVSVSTYKIGSATAVATTNAVAIADYTLPTGDTVITITGTIPAI